MIDDLTGQQVGQYLITERIGAGGMAVVYKARQESIKRNVAFKVMTSQFMHDPTFQQRFRREVELIARLEHPRILPVYDFGEFDGRPYIVMAYMPGGTLADRINDKTRPLSLEEVIRFVEQIAEGLDHAHREGVIHRDFKPSNVLLDRSGNAHLADFGIAKLQEDSLQLTGDRIIGTLFYMAPEMFRQETLTPAIDIYALGVTLYQMLTGSVPYSGDTAQVIGGHLHQPVPDVCGQRPDLPAGVAEVIRRAMAKDAMDRFPTAGALAKRLRIEAEQGSRVQTARSPAAERTLLEEEYTPETLPDPVPRAAPTREPEPPAPVPAPATGRRGPSIPLVGGIGLGLVVVIGLCGVGGFLIARGLNTPAAPTAGSVAYPPTAPPATEAPEPTRAPTVDTGGDSIPPDEPVDDEGPTPAPADDRVEQAVHDYDTEVRYLLETGDTTRIGAYATGKALDDRLNAAAILKSAGDCHWDYDHRGLEIRSIDYQGETRAIVLATVDRDGTVFCGTEERDEYAFEGPYDAIFVLDRINGNWIVSDYCPYDSCPEELKN